MQKFYLLSLNKDLYFFKSLKTKLSNIKQFNLLYKGSEHDFCPKKLHSLCNNNKGPTLTIIKSNDENVFGGYSSKSWISDINDGWIKDEHSFLFLVQSNQDKYDRKCPLLFDIKKEFVQYALFGGQRGPIFGAGHDILISPKNCYVRKSSFDYGEFDGNLCNTVHLIDYEVFALEMN